MSLTELSYEELKQEFNEELKQKPDGAVATSAGDKVTNRFMQLIYDELTIRCFTTEGARKLNQVSVNPNVSVATGSFNIDGTATITGHPLDEQNARFIELFKEQQPEMFAIAESVFFPNKASRVIEITPTRIGKWVEGGYMDILNISTGKAFRLEALGEFQISEYYE